MVAGAAGLLAFPAAAAAATTSSAHPPVSETDRLQRLIRLELLLLYCYRHVLDSGILGPHAQRTLTTFPGHEQAHVAALERRLTARGGAVPPGPDSIATANRYLANRGVGGRLGQLKGERDALYLLRPDTYVGLAAAAPTAAALDAYVAERGLAVTAVASA